MRMRVQSKFLERVVCVTYVKSEGDTDAPAAEIPGKIKFVG
jgi:hypothetical protein